MARTLGRHLERRLNDRFGNHRHVGDIRGRGLLQAIELVADRSGKLPFDPALKLNLKVKEAALKLGLACYPGGGTIDGRRGDHILPTSTTRPYAAPASIIQVGETGDRTSTPP